jgi:hypothetical protein
VSLFPAFLSTSEFLRIQLTEKFKTPTAFAVGAFCSQENGQLVLYVAAVFSDNAGLEKSGLAAL